MGEIKTLIKPTWIIIKTFHVRVINRRTMSAQLVFVHGTSMPCRAWSNSRTTTNTMVLALYPVPVLRCFEFDSCH